MTTPTQVLFKSKTAYIRHLAYLDAKRYHTEVGHPRYDSDYPLPTGTHQISHLDAYFTAVLLMSRMHDAYDLEGVHLYPEFPSDLDVHADGQIGNTGGDQMAEYLVSGLTLADCVQAENVVAEDFLTQLKWAYDETLRQSDFSIRMLLTDNTALCQFYQGQEGTLDWGRIQAFVFDYPIAAEEAKSPV